MDFSAMHVHDGIRSYTIRQRKTLQMRRKHWFKFVPALGPIQEETHQEV